LGKSTQLETVNKFPAPIYLETVLGRNFADAQKYFLEDLIEIKVAHTVMLAESGIIPKADSVCIIAALRAIDVAQVRAFKYDGSCEDLYFYLESLVVKQVGEEVGGKMRVARSRNDVDMTLYRMGLRRELLATLEALGELRRAVIDLASQHRHTVMPAHTHTQPAQPTTLAHYLAAAAEFMARDAKRLLAAYETVNRSPMGACAITTTGFPIRRELTAQLLGFDGVVENSYGAIAAADYLTNSCATLSVAMISVGRFVQDLLLWSTQEFGYLRLPESFVQISSIMPQKRNPVALEHARVLSSRASMESLAVLQSIHNTPFGDINDTEDDMQPLVYTAFDNARRALRLLAGLLAGVEVDVAKLRDRAGRNFLTVTELADTLVREAGLTFGKAHEIVSRGVKNSRDEEELLQTILAEKLLDEATLRRALDPVNFVAIRGIVGGPAPEETARALQEAEQQLQGDLLQSASLRGKLDAAHRRLNSSVQ
jgi:argininosuccinate lyase